LRATPYSMGSSYRVLKAAGYRIDSIYTYTRDNWGEAQAQKYINGLFVCFENIAKHDVLWQPIPAAYEVSGYYTRYEKHFVYWRELSDGSVGITTILHERMNLGDRLVEDLA